MQLNDPVKSLFLLLLTAILPVRLLGEPKLYISNQTGAELLYVGVTWRSAFSTTHLKDCKKLSEATFQTFSNGTTKEVILGANTEFQITEVYCVDANGNYKKKSWDTSPFVVSDARIEISSFEIDFRLPGESVRASSIGWPLIDLNVGCYFARGGVGTGRVEPLIWKNLTIDKLQFAALALSEIELDQNWTDERAKTLWLMSYRRSFLLQTLTDGQDENMSLNDAIMNLYPEFRNYLSDPFAPRSGYPNEFYKLTDLIKAATEKAAKVFKRKIGRSK